jgi:hypothetical protein
MSVAAAKEKLGEAAKLIGVAKETFADSPEKQKRINQALRSIATAIKTLRETD